MKSTNAPKSITTPDGITWGVAIQMPTSSSAQIIFRHPAGNSSRLDRYNWIISQGPESRSVTSRLDSNRVLDDLDPATILRLFQRSMPISRPNDPNDAPEPARG